jgi:tetratricopeptide (TPR) repeat protein
MKNPTKELFALGVFKLFAIVVISLLIISCENKTTEKVIYLNDNDVSMEEVLDINNELNNLLEKNYSKLEESITSAKGKDTLLKNHAINYLKICLFLIKSQNNVEKSEFYFKKFINHLSTQKNRAEIDIFYKIQKCDFYVVSNERKKSRLLLDEILNFVNIDKNFKLYYQAKYIEAKVLCNEYQYTKGIEVLLNVYEAVKKNPDIKLNKYLILNNLALYLNEMRKYDQAMDYLNLALKELKNTDKLNELYLTYSNIGIILGDQKKHQAAIDTLLKSVEINKKLNRRSNSIITYYNIGRSYTDLGNYAKANQYFLLGLDQTKELGFEVGYCYLYFGLGNNYYKSKEYARALNYLNKAVDYCRKMDNKAILFNSIKNIIEIAQINNDAQTVLKYFDEYKTLQEEYHKYVLNEQVEEMILKMDVEKINSKNKLLSQEVALNEKINQKQTLLIYTESFIVVLILISIFLLYRSNKKKQRINQQLATQKIEIEKSNKNLIRLIADRDNLVKTIIHDLRNPLSAIKGCANLMVEEVDENEKEVLLNMMNSSANRLDMLISSLLY